MTRKEQIKEAAENEMHKYPNYCITIPAFKMGAVWADAHPHWISVESEMPDDGVDVAVINKANHQMVCFRYRGKWFSKYGNEYADITHWMPLPQPPKGGEE